MFAGICGLTLAIIGLATGGFTFGTGYEQAHQILSGEVTKYASPLYPLSKLMATIVSYWSGIPGGIFAPTLSVGANLGAQLAVWVPPEQATAVALLGMVGYFTGVVQSPITAVVIVMELTNQPSMLLPLMGTALIAEWVAQHICHRPLYRMLADAYMKPMSHT
jgi:H+/Cl- antiporter ClcA